MSEPLQYPASNDPFILEIRVNIEEALQKMEQEEGAIFLVKILDVFRKRVRDDLTELKDGLEELDCDLIRRKAHLMVGSFRALGFNDGAQYAKEAELLARDENKTELPPATNKLLVYMNETLRIANDLLPDETNKS